MSYSRRLVHINIIFSRKSSSADCSLLLLPMIHFVKQSLTATNIYLALFLFAKSTKGFSAKCQKKNCLGTCAALLFNAAFPPSFIHQSRFLLPSSQKSLHWICLLVLSPFYFPNLLVLSFCQYLYNRYKITFTGLFRELALRYQRKNERKNKLFFCNPLFPNGIVLLCLEGCIKVMHSQILK